MNKADRQAMIDAGKKGVMLKRLRRKADNFRVVTLPLGVQSGLLTLFRSLPK